MMEKTRMYVFRNLDPEVGQVLSIEKFGRNRRPGAQRRIVVHHAHLLAYPTVNVFFRFGGDGWKRRRFTVLLYLLF